MFFHCISIHFSCRISVPLFFPGSKLNLIFSPYPFFGDSFHVMTSHRLLTSLWMSLLGSDPYILDSTGHGLEDRSLVTRRLSQTGFFAVLFPLEGFWAWAT